MTGQWILLVGATGVFGGRLARQLAAFPDITVVVTSRDRSRAEALATKLREGGAVAEITALAFDNRADLPKLASMAPWLVIDASGPFQNGDFSLARASLEAGAHYLDLADARSHVFGFSSALDALARERGLVALTGASSTPALSNAMVETPDRRLEARQLHRGRNHARRRQRGRPVRHRGDPVLRRPQDSGLAWRPSRQHHRLGDRRAMGCPRSRPPVGLAGRDARRRNSFSPFRRQGPGALLAGLESKAEHSGMLALARAFRGIPFQDRRKLLHGARVLRGPSTATRRNVVPVAASKCGGEAPDRAQWRPTTPRTTTEPSCRPSPPWRPLADLLGG